MIGYEEEGEVFSVDYLVVVEVEQFQLEDLMLVVDKNYSTTTEKNINILIQNG